MGDIAFNLIVFFVILARVHDDSHLKWTPSRVADVEQGKLSNVSVVINDENKIFINGQETGASALSGQIEIQLKGVVGKDRVVQFKFHKEAPVSIIEPVFEAIGKAGADAFMIVEKE